MIEAKRRRRAIELRDLAITVVGAQGSYRKYRELVLDREITVFEYKRDDLRIRFHTPFEARAQPGVPYSVDVWCPTDRGN